MWIASVGVAGMADGDGQHALERVARLPCAVLDAIDLFRCGATDQAQDTVRLGWAPTVEEDVRIGRPQAVRTMGAAPPEHRIQITLTLAPDPPLFGRLRNAVLRSPTLASGLADNRFTARVGWLFTPDHAVAQPDLVGVRLGELDVPLGENVWAAPLIAEVATRIHLVDWRAPLQDTIDLLCSAALSPDPTLRARGEQAASILDGLGLEVRPVRTDRYELVVGPNLRPLSWSGPRAEMWLRVVTAAVVRAPDILLVPWTPDPDLQTWLERACTGDDAVLEQVVTSA